MNEDWIDRGAELEESTFEEWCAKVSEMIGTRLSTEAEHVLRVCAAAHARNVDESVIGLRPHSSMAPFGGRGIAEWAIRGAVTLVKLQTDAGTSVMAAGSAAQTGSRQGR